MCMRMRIACVGNGTLCERVTDSLTNDLHPPPLPVPDFGSRRTGVLCKQARKEEPIASRTRASSDGRVWWGLATLLKVMVVVVVAATRRQKAWAIFRWTRAFLSSDFLFFFGRR